MKKLLTLTILLLSLHYISAQVSGTIVDNQGEPLVGATVIEKGTYNGTTTDLNGAFSLQTKSDNPVLVVSFTGFAQQEFAVSDDVINIALSEGSTLDEVVVTGTRGKPRTVLASPVPIDNINAAELRNSGQRSLDQIINYKVPSYNSQNQSISDATAHIDPSELRNLGPSRTLVLINGKRKNQSAQVYLNDTPGRGEVGTDMKSIPASAIERVEVLRDGAAAQYGSDAIAGVVNVILKERTTGQINVDLGISTLGDGETASIDFNKGFALGSSGFINLTGEYLYQGITDRAGEFAPEVGDPLFGIAVGDDPEIDAFFQEFPDLGITYGQPEISKLSLFANFGTDYGNNGQFYGNLGFTGRDGTSFAFYRTPYWITDDFGLLTEPGQPYVGFQPTFETDITDLTGSLGTRNQLGEWDSDLSITFGSNSIDYTVNNSLNTSLGASSPTSFNPGGYSFGNFIANYDISRTTGPLSLAFGAEFRTEFFEARQGDEASFTPAPGAQSFPGLTPLNAVDEGRSNIGVYGSLDYDVSDAFLIGGALRFENYSDFGSNVSWKLNSRYLIGDNQGAIRGSVSTGFRAPSLHQIFLSNIQTTAGASGLVQEGTFSNVDDITRNVLGVPQLDAETALNFTLGLTYKLSDKVSFSADYYNITVSDRILFSEQVGAGNFEGTPLGNSLADANVDAFKFFINGVDTKTSGVDIVFNVDNLRLNDAGNTLNIILAANFNNTDLDGDVVAPPAFGSVPIFADLSSNLLTSARPDTKITLGGNLNLGKLDLNLNNTFFGSVNSPVTGQEFAGKIITDLIGSYRVSDNFRLTATVNNLFNVFPDRIDINLDPFGSRLQFPWRVSQFGFTGTFVKISGTLDF